MIRLLRLITPVMLTVIVAVPARAQKQTLGINLRISGTPDVGMTWFVTPSVAIRPTLAATSITVPSPAGDSKLSQVGLTTDVLLYARPAERIATYVGFGATIASLSSNVFPDQKTWGIRTLFGVRGNVIERVALFGEVALSYERGDEDEREIGLATLPIGIMVFLK
jgi:hypothetical protein